MIRADVKRKLLLLVLSFPVGAVAVGGSRLLQDPSYQSRAILFVSESFELLPSASQAIAGVPRIFGGGTVQDYLAAVLDSDSFKLRLIKASGLIDSEEFWDGTKPEHRTWEKALLIFQSNDYYRVSVGQGTLKLVSVGPNPEIPFSIINLSNQFLQEQVQEDASVKLSKLEKVLEETEASLRASEEAVVDFQSSALCAKIA